MSVGLGRVVRLVVVAAAVAGLWAVSAMVALGVAAAHTAAQEAVSDDAAALETVGGAPAGDGDAARLLARAVEAGDELSYDGEVAVVSLADDGPRLATLTVARGEGGVRVGRGDDEEFGRADGEGFLRSSSRLLRVGGIERVPAHVGRLEDKYSPRLEGTRELDTGTATVVALVDSDLEVVRERLYADDDTGLVVRRETFDADGEPVRLVAFTELRPGATQVDMPASGHRSVEQHEVEPREIVRLREAGFVVPERLGRGFELLATLDVPAASVPTAHLVYGDGLYTVSVFQQLGRLDRRAVAAATELTTDDGASVWRWPGSEPRRLVWTGEGITFTALGDAPTDEVLAAIAELPSEPAPGLFGRLVRGLERIGRGLMPG